MSHRHPAAVISLATVLVALPTSSLGSGAVLDMEPAPIAHLQGAAPAAPPVAVPPVAAPPVAAPPGAVPPSAEAVARVRDRLSRALVSRARIVLQREVLFLGVLQNSRDLMRMSLALEPDNPFAWRLALDLASILEDGDPAADAWLSEGLARLSRLEPDDEIIRLRRIVDAIDRKRTAEERIAAHQAMLTPEAVDRIGPSVAARLAFDLATLLRRTGDIDGFESNLLIAIDLDPFYPEAAELAAGYFRMKAPSAVDEVRALRVAVLANPMNDSAALGLVDLCLSRGAYRASESLLEIQSRLKVARGVDETYDAILADYILTLWANGKPGIGFAVAAQRQRTLDGVLIEEIERQGITMTMDEREKTHLPPAPPLAVVIAAMSSGTEAKSASVAAANVGIAFDGILDQLTKRKATAEQIAPVALESAFAQLWLGGSVDKSEVMLTKAAEYGPLSDAARARFDGWIAYRRKNIPKAKELLTPIADQDPAAKLGLALVALESGDKKEAARLLLDVARAQPGTAMGVWARARLFAVLGTTAPITAESELIERAAELPPGYLKVMRDGGDSMFLQIVPEQSDALGWDPLRFTLELTNRSAWPLPIGPEGPIKDSTTLSASINVPGETPRAPQIIIQPIDRKFVLGPGEKLRIPVDLSVTDASAALRDDVLSGAFVSLHSIVNWKTTNTGFEPSSLGLEVESPVVHVSGERVSREWVESALAQLRDATRSPEPELISLIANALVRKSAASPLVPEDAAKALEGAGDVLADAARRLWPEARAWLIFACPKGKRVEQGKEAQDLLDVVASGGVELASAVPELEALDAVLRSDESSIARVSWLAVRTRRPEDPTLIASLESKDPAVKSYAESCKQWLIEARDERAKQLNLKK